MSKRLFYLDILGYKTWSVYQKKKNIDYDKLSTKNEYDNICNPTLHSPPNKTDILDFKQNCYNTNAKLKQKLHSKVGNM